MRFWRLTPIEFAAIARGHHIRQYDEMWRTTYQALLIASSLVKVEKKPQDLIGPRPTWNGLSTFEG